MQGRGRWFHGRIRGCGYRLTLPRMKIVEVLNASKGHLSAEEVFIKVHQVYPAVGLTTVYRTLEMLVASGIVARIDAGDGKARYEFKKTPEEDPHFHLICKKCGSIINVDSDKELEKHINMAKEKYVKDYGFKVDNLQLRFYGLCKKCK
jgi:Fur family ferric uptake transcriptional regulator